MRRFDDETLVAFVDGELDEATATEVAHALEADAELAARVEMFRSSSVLVRAAFAGVIDEPVPERLMAAARGAAADDAGGKVVPFPKRRPIGRWIALPLAASVAALMIGASAGYWAGRSPVAPPVTETAATSGLVDNLAGYYDLYTVGGEPEQMAFADMRTAERDGLQSWLSSRLDRETKVPDLSPFGYNLRGGRIVISEGRPAGQIIYENPTDKRPIAIYVGATTKRDAQLTLDQRKDVNVAYWRREGRTIAVFGKSDKSVIRDIATKVDQGGGI
ncbi:anti-sigma factor [Stella sp.]|uniref:anti-sigma factor family protein n=1 Tax=Stella sp. TaxID=2912054 RepID=UPI0035AD84CC